MQTFEKLLMKIMRPNIIDTYFDTFCIYSVRDLFLVFDLAGLCLLRTYLLLSGVRS